VYVCSVYVYIIAVCMFVLVRMHIRVEIGYSGSLLIAYFPEQAKLFHYPEYSFILNILSCYANSGDCLIINACLVLCSPSPVPVSQPSLLHDKIYILKCFLYTLTHDIVWVVGVCSVHSVQLNSV
jgi:hypothetical protein